MDLEKLKSLLNDRAEEEVGDDFLKDAREIMRGNFPKMRKMKRRLALEVGGMTLFAIALVWFHNTLPWHSIWVTVMLIILIVCFLALEIAAFRAYWYTPSDIGRVESVRKFSRRLNAVTNPMILIRGWLAFFCIVFIYIEIDLGELLHGSQLPEDIFKYPAIVKLLNITELPQHIFNWRAVMLLMLLLVAISAFSFRWISHANRAREQAESLMQENKLE